MGISYRGGKRSGSSRPSVRNIPKGGISYRGGKRIGGGGGVSLPAGVSVSKYQAAVPFMQASYVAAGMPGMTAKGIAMFTKAATMPSRLTHSERAYIRERLPSMRPEYRQKFVQFETQERLSVKLEKKRKGIAEEYRDVRRVGLPGITTGLFYGVTPETTQLAERTWKQISGVKPISFAKMGVAISPLGITTAPFMAMGKNLFPKVQKELVTTYKGIKPPPEVSAYERRAAALETGFTAFETKWEPYVKGERFVGTEQQYQQMAKERTVLERQVTPVEEAQRGLMEPPSIKAERKLKGYKTGWIYAGTEKFFETKYLPYVRKQQEAVSTWQREKGYKPSEHPWLKEIEHAQWYTMKELPAMTLRMGAALPPAFEAAVFKPKERAKMEAAVIPGFAFMGKGMIEEAQREPLGFTETMVLSLLGTKAVVKVSPIKYMGMKVPTGKSIVKTWTTIGKGMPSEFRELKAAAGPRAAIEFGKIEPTWAPGIYKQTHLIPEMVTYRGLRASLPSVIPYKGKAPLVGVITRPPGKRPTQMGTPAEYAQYLIAQKEVGGVFTFRKPYMVAKRFKEEGLLGEIAHLPKIEAEKSIAHALREGYAASDILRDVKMFTRTGAPHEIYLAPSTLTSHMRRQLKVIEGRAMGKGTSEQLLTHIKEKQLIASRQEVLAHELYHYKYPKATEAQILEMEKAFALSETKKLFEIPGAKVKRVEWTRGAPEFEIPATFRVFTGPEATLVMPSMRKMLKGEELALWKANIYLSETFGRKRPIMRAPIRMGELEHLKEAFGGTEGLQEFTQYIQKYRRQMLIYGSAAKKSQLARPELITAKDIDLEIRSMAARLSGLTTETKVPFRARLTPFEVEMAHRAARKIPGLTPEQVAADLAAISKKHLGAEQVQISFKPAWQMFSVEKVLKTMEKTQWGLEPEVMTLADIHPPSGPFEFGLKPQRPIKVPVISGLPGEKIPFLPKRIRITTLGEEFERSFGSTMQMFERKGVVKLGPRPKRVKDIMRHVQEGKMIIETDRLYAEMGLRIFKGKRMRKVEKGRAALGLWEKRALAEPELKEFVPAIKAEAFLPGMESALKQQMPGYAMSEFLRAEEAVAFMGRRVKPKVRLHDTEYPRMEVGKLPDTAAYYPVRRRGVPSDYYPPQALPYATYDYYPKPAPAYADSGYYGTPMHKLVTKRGVPTPVIGMIPTAFVPFSIPKAPTIGVFKPTPVPKMITGMPTPTTAFVPPPGIWAPPPTGVPPFIPGPPLIPPYIPPTPPSGPPYVPPTIPSLFPPPSEPPYTPPIFPPMPPSIFPLLPSEEKPRRRKKKYKFGELPWKEKHYIPTLQELMRHAPGMETSKLTTMEPKMPKLPKGIM